MRSAEELVRELDQEARHFSMVAIVVAFDDTSRYVFHDDDPNKVLAELQEMIAAGGEPFGLLGYCANEKEANVSSFVYDEYKSTIWAEPLLNELSDNLVSALGSYQRRSGSA